VKRNSLETTEDRPSKRLKGLQGSPHTLDPSTPNGRNFERVLGIAYPVDGLDSRSA